MKGKLRPGILGGGGEIAGVEEVFVNFATALSTAPQAAPAAAQGQKAAGHKHGPAGGQPPQGPRGLPGVKHIVAVGAGKGGVGKSTVAVNLAVGLALLGKKVGILDGDIYGPSVPTLTGIEPQNPQIEGDRIIPFMI